MGWRLELQALLLPAIAADVELKPSMCARDAAPLVSARSGNSTQPRPDGPTSTISRSSTPRRPRRRAAGGLPRRFPLLPLAPYAQGCFCGGLIQFVVLFWVLYILSIVFWFWSLWIYGVVIRGDGNKSKSLSKMRWNSGRSKVWDMSGGL